MVLPLFGMRFGDRFLSVGLRVYMVFSLSGLAFFAFALTAAFYGVLQLLEGSVLPSASASSRPVRGQGSHGLAHPSRAPARLSLLPRAGVAPPSLAVASCPGHLPLPASTRHPRRPPRGLPSLRPAAAPCNSARTSCRSSLPRGRGDRRHQRPFTGL